MSVYSHADEERLRLQARVRAWTRAGLLDRSRGAALDAELRTDVRRTNVMFRAALAAFTVLIALALFWLLLVAFEIRSRIPMATLMLMYAVTCFGVAELMVRRWRIYRYGMEEALTTIAIVLAGFSTAELASAELGVGGNGATIFGFAVAAAAAFVVYWRFGFVYAAVAGMACAAVIPFNLDRAPWLERLMAAAILGAACAFARAGHLKHGDDYPGDDDSALQAAAWVGVYVTLNLHLFDLLEGNNPRITDDRAFYWTTYAITWLMPIAGLALALREKNRWFILANLVLALATLATNKPYLGWARQSWDPMVLGALLTIAAVALRRWLSRGPGGERFGFTPARVLEPDRDFLRALGTASAAIHAPAAPASQHSSTLFDGGRSGGGGASGSF